MYLIGIDIKFAVFKRNKTVTLIFLLAKYIITNLVFVGRHVYGFRVLPLRLVASIVVVVLHFTSSTHFS